MANVSEKFGLRPYRKLDGTPLVGAQNRYTIASGYSDAIFQGEMVEPLGTGNIQRHGPNTSDAVVVFLTDVFTQTQLLKNQHTVTIILVALLLVILLHSSLTIQTQYF